MQMKSELLKIKSLNELNDVGVGIICLATSRNVPTLGLTAPRPARNTHMSRMRRLHHYTTTPNTRAALENFPLFLLPVLISFLHSNHFIPHKTLSVFTSLC